MVDVYQGVAQTHHRLVVSDLILITKHPNAFPKIEKESIIWATLPGEPEQEDTMQLLEDTYYPKALENPNPIEQGCCNCGKTFQPEDGIVYLLAKGQVHRKCYCVECFQEAIKKKR